MEKKNASDTGKGWPLLLTARSKGKCRNTLRKLHCSSPGVRGPSKPAAAADLCIFYIGTCALLRALVVPRITLGSWMLLRGMTAADAPTAPCVSHYTSRWHRSPVILQEVTVILPVGLSFEVTGILNWNQVVWILVSLAASYTCYLTMNRIISVISIFA